VYGRLFDAIVSEEPALSDLYISLMKRSSGTLANAAMVGRHINTPAETAAWSGIDQLR